jgi:GNAT superfamily N-acetyltransferase
VLRDPLLPEDARRGLLRSVTPTSVLERSQLYHLAVSDSGKAIEGFGGLDLNEIRLLYVCPVFQGRGVGRALLAHFEEMVPPSFFSDIFVYAALSAAGFYLKCGYQPAGEWRFDDGGASLNTMFMRKVLR